MSKSAIPFIDFNRTLLGSQMTHWNEPVLFGRKFTEYTPLTSKLGARLVEEDFHPRDGATVTKKAKDDQLLDPVKDLEGKWQYMTENKTF